MKRVALVAALILSATGSARGQMGCRDFSDDEWVTYTRPSLIFTVDHPESMSWLLELSETRVKFRAMPPQMVGFEFSQSGSPVVESVFRQDMADWQVAFEIDYGGTPVQIYAAPYNDGPLAEYAALLPHSTDTYRLSIQLESASPDCDYAAALEEAIKTIRPASDS